MPSIGLWAIAIANGLGLLISFLIIFRYLKSRGHSIRPNWGLLARIIAYVAVAIALGRFVRHMEAPVWLAAALAEISFLLVTCIWPPLLREERQLVLSSLTAAVRRFTRK